MYVCMYVYIRRIYINYIYSFSYCLVAPRPPSDHFRGGSLTTPMLKVMATTFLLVCFVYLKNSTCKTWKNYFYFTSKALFVLQIIKL